MSPPKRATTKGKSTGSSKKSFSKKKTTHTKNGNTDVGNVGATEANLKSDKSTSKAKQGEARSSSKKSAGEKANTKNKAREAPSSRSASRTESDIEKTRVSRVASSQHADGKSRDGTANGNESEADEFVDDGEYSMSTAPAPPTLRVRNNLTLRPGAYRVATGGVARYVNSATDDLDNYSQQTLNESGYHDAFDTEALDASLVEDEPMPLPPIHRPTTSGGYTYADHSTVGVTSTAPTAAMTYSTGTTMAIAEEPSLEKENTKETTFFTKRNILILVCFLVVFIIVVASIGAAYSIRKGRNGNIGEPPSRAPITPSEAALESFIETLPDYTQTSLLNSDSPQSKAIGWMSTYDDIESYDLTRQTQRFALVSFFYSISSTTLSHEVLTWLAGTDECVWYDSICVDNVYTALSLESGQQFGFGGTLVPEIALLTSLERLRIDQHKFEGLIPTTLGQLTTLKQIHMNDNRFRGTIPSEFGKLRNLEDVNLSNNLLSGGLPSEIGWWWKVETLMLENNDLEGTVPTEIGRLSQLSSLSLSTNWLRGALPTTIGRLTKLVELDISENKLSGSLPAEVGFLTSLTLLKLNSNSFDDELPSELGNLVDAEVFALYDNEFDGIVPDEICHLESLAQKDLIVDCHGTGGLLCFCCTCAPRKND
jgi:hypothetical protein